MSCRLRRQHHKESLQIQVFMTTFIFYNYRYAMNCRLRRQQHKETLEIQVNATFQHFYSNLIPRKSKIELNLNIFILIKHQKLKKINNLNLYLL